MRGREDVQEEQQRSPRMMEPLRPAPSNVGAPGSRSRSKDQKSGSVGALCFLTTHGDAVRCGGEGPRPCLPHFPT